MTEAATGDKPYPANKTHNSESSTISYNTCISKKKKNQEKVVDLLQFNITCNNVHCTFVSPAIGATLQTFFERKVLMTELLPTLG